MNKLAPNLFTTAYSVTEFVNKIKKELKIYLEKWIGVNGRSKINLSLNDNYQLYYDFFIFRTTNTQWKNEIFNIFPGFKREMLKLVKPKKIRESKK